MPTSRTCGIAPRSATPLRRLCGKYSKPRKPGSRRHVNTASPSPGLVIAPPSTRSRERTGMPWSFLCKAAGDNPPHRLVGVLGTRDEKILLHPTGNDSLVLPEDAPQVGGPRSEPCGAGNTRYRIQERKTGAHEPPRSQLLSFSGLLQHVRQSSGAQAWAPSCTQLHSLTTLISRPQVSQTHT